MSYLTENADKIINDIRANEALLKHYGYLISAFNGNLDPLFEKRLGLFQDAKIKSDMRLHKELPNYFQYAVRKLTQIYNHDIERKAFIGDTESVEAMNDVEKLLKYVSFKEVMHTGNGFSNASNSVYLEVYHNKKFELCVRALPNNTMTCWTDDEVDPNLPSVFIKFIKDLEVPQELRVKGVTENKLYVMYTADEILYWESVGRPNREPMRNPLGFIPFYYVNYDRINLLPERDTASEGLAIGPAFDVTKTNLAAHHQGSPMRVFENVDENKLKAYAGYDGAIMISGNPDTPSLAPKFYEIASTLNIGMMQEWIRSKIEDYLMTKGVPVKKDGNVDQSALSIIIQGADTIEARKSQITTWRPADEDIVELVIKYHNWLFKNKPGQLPKRYPLKKLLSEDIRIETLFSLPSAEAEQAQQAKGVDVKVGEEQNGDKPNVKATESAAEDTEGN